MAVVCSHCGEELLGAVNRCWRCGKNFAIAYDGQPLPRVRRAPIVLPAVGEETLAMTTDGVLLADVVDADATRVAEPRVRRGSPFAPGTDRPTRSAERRAKRLSFWSAEFAAMLGLVIAVLALLLTGWSEYVSGVLAALAVVSASFGIYQERRGVAVVAVLLGTLGIAISGFFVAVSLYTWRFGHAPWELP